MRTWMLWALVAACSACSAEAGQPNPVPREQPEIPAAAEPAETRRQVELRSPFGGRVGNLLVDGDFEQSIVVEGSGPQSGWLAFGGTGYLRGGTGGMCRSGMRCGWLDVGVSLFGQGTSAQSSGMIASAYARPPEGFGCFSVQMQVLRCNSFVSAAVILPESETPAADGWCHYRGRVAQQTSAVCMFVETNLANGAALIDDASILPDTGNVPLSLGGGGVPDVTFQPLRGEQRERVRALLEWRRNRMKLGTPLEGRPTIGER